MLKELDLEMVVLSKLLLRGRNQHRREKYYQMLVRVCRDFKRYREVGLMEDKLFPKQSKMCRRHMPKLVTLTKKVHCGLYFTAHFLHFIERTFVEVQKQLSRGLFISTNLVVLALLSRIWYLMKYHLSALSRYRRGLPDCNVPVSKRLQAILSSLTRTTTSNAQEDLGAVVLRAGASSVEDRNIKAITYSPTSPETMTTLPSSTPILKQARRNAKTRRNRKCWTRISIVLKGRRVWLNLHPRLADRVFLVNTKIISVRRPSIFSRDYTIVRGTVVMKLACKHHHFQRSRNVFGSNRKREKDLEILQKQFARDLEEESNVAVVSPEQGKVIPVKETDIMDDIFSVCTIG